MRLPSIKAWMVCANAWNQCIRASKTAHKVYKKVRAPLHGAYFCTAAWELHTISILLASIPLTLLGLMVVGFYLEEDAP